MITNRIKELEDQVAKLQAQLKHEKEKFIDWDNLTLDELKERFSRDSFWNSWDICPVGSLLDQETRNRYIYSDKDEVLYHLGQLTCSAYDGSWVHFISCLRRAVRLYLEEQK